MASQTRQAREAERKLSVRTLAIASASSAIAAVVVSQFWKGGTAPAAAVTPVIVSIVSELLHKPTQAIAARVTSDRTAVLPEGMGAGAPPTRTEVAATAPAQDLEGRRPASEERPPPLREDGEEPVPSAEREQRGTITYHRAGQNGAGGGSGARRRFPTRVVAATAALAFLIGAAVLTVPELIAGESLGKSRGGTTLFGGERGTGASGDGDSDRQDGSEQRTPEQPPTDRRPAGQDGAEQQPEQQPKQDQPPSQPPSGESQPPQGKPPQGQPQQGQPQQGRPPAQPRQAQPQQAPAQP